MPLDIEIGCGVGLHAIQRAAAFPERKFIAIERGRERFLKFQRRLLHHSPFPNLEPVQAHAIEWITLHIEKQSVDHYYFLYPNPYPKPKQRKKRWHNMSFMEVLLSTLKPGALITLATNEAFYFSEAIETLQNRWGLKLIKQRKISKETHSDFLPRTHFEKKYFERGQILFEGLFTNGAVDLKNL